MAALSDDEFAALLTPEVAQRRERHMTLLERALQPPPEVRPSDERLRAIFDAAPSVKPHEHQTPLLMAIAAGGAMPLLVEGMIAADPESASFSKADSDDDLTFDAEKVPKCAEVNAKCATVLHDWLVEVAEAGWRHWNEEESNAAEDILEMSRTKEVHSDGASASAADADVPQLTVAITSINHPTNGANGKYFYFDADVWTAMAGSGDWTSSLRPRSGTTFTVVQTRDDVVVWRGTVVVWNNHNGIHGRRNSGAQNGNWRVGDVVCCAESPVEGNHGSVLAAKAMFLTFAYLKKHPKLPKVKLQAVGIAAFIVATQYEWHESEVRAFVLCSAYRARCMCSNLVVCLSSLSHSSYSLTYLLTPWPSLLTYVLTYLLTYLLTRLPHFNTHTHHHHRGAQWTLHAQLASVMERTQRKILQRRSQSSQQCANAKVPSSSPRFSVVRCWRSHLHRTAADRLHDVWTTPRSARSSVPRPMQALR